MVSNEKVSMNKDLKKWMHDSKQNIKNRKNKKDEITKVSGNCQICGVNKAEVVCLKCERFVCKSCYFKIIGICKMCIPEDIAKRWDGSNPDWEKKLGIEWIE